MDLQNQQLKELNDWLTKTEEKTRKMEKEPLGPDLEDLKQQIQQHKVSVIYAVCFLVGNKLYMYVYYVHILSWFADEKELKLQLKRVLK